MKLSEAKIRRVIKEICEENYNWNVEFLTIDDFRDVVNELTKHGYIRWYLSPEENSKNFRATKYVTTAFSYTFYRVDSLTNENNVEDVIDLINKIDQKYKTTKVTFLENQNGWDIKDWGFE